MLNTGTVQMACSTLNKLHVQAVLVSCLFYFPGKAYVTIRDRSKSIRGGGGGVPEHLEMWAIKNT